MSTSTPSLTRSCFSVFNSSRSRAGTPFQVVSDLHLEYCSQYTSFQIPPKAPYLVLAGNIGRLADYDLYLDFLQTICRHYCRIFLVLGNHEYFGLSRKEGRHLANKLQAEPVLEGRVAILQRKRFHLGTNITVLGCTLNSGIPPEAYAVVTEKIKDFTQIAEWTVADHVREHLIDAEWLENEIHALRKEQGPDHKIIVITHHAPFVRESVGEAQEGYAEALTYRSALLGGGSMMDEANWWIFGHTGVSTETRIGRVRLLSNQRGYITPFEDENTAVTKEHKANIFGRAARKKHEFDVGKVIRV